MTALLFVFALFCSIRIGMLIERIRSFDREDSE